MSDSEGLRAWKVMALSGEYLQSTNLGGLYYTTAHPDLIARLMPGLENSPLSPNGIGLWEQIPEYAARSQDGGTGSLFAYAPHGTGNPVPIDRSPTGASTASIGAAQPVLMTQPPFYRLLIGENPSATVEAVPKNTVVLCGLCEGPEWLQWQTSPQPVTESEQAAMFRLVASHGRKSWPQD